MDRLVVIGLLTKLNHGEWAAPGFIILKIDGRVRFISDFRLLNKKFKPKPYPLPHIKYMLNKISNFTYDITLDLLVGYYNISLTDASKKICMITTQFYKY